MRRWCLDFYIERCKQIKQRFQFGNKAFLFASTLEPGEVISTGKAKVVFRALWVFVDCRFRRIECQTKSSSSKVASRCLCSSDKDKNVEEITFSGLFLENYRFP